MTAMSLPFEFERGSEIGNGLRGFSPEFFHLGEIRPQSCDLESFACPHNRGTGAGSSPIESSTSTIIQLARASRRIVVVWRGAGNRVDRRWIAGWGDTALEVGVDGDGERALPL